MGVWSDLRRAFAAIPEPEPEPGRFATSVRTREIIALRETSRDERPQMRAGSTFPDWDTQLLAAQGLSSTVWRYPTINEALGVPAIFRAVSLIANTTGSLPIEAFRNGALLLPSDTPRVVQRPDPFHSPRVFYRDSAYYIATRGEAWWWTARRDPDGQPLSLIVVPPWEVGVDRGRDRMRPIITWNGNVMPNADMRQITFLTDDTTLRGVGPLQMCGAAVSVAVEAQTWAANFFAEDGGYPSIGIKAAGMLAEDPDTGVSEADTLRDQWMSKPHNTPRVYDDGIEEIKEFGVNQSGAQMLEAREYQNGDAARMFGIPGSLLEHSTPGSSLTYQNLEGEYTKFVRTCLAPNYLEPIEQEMSDLLTRSTVSRFNVRGLQRADVKTRYEVHKIAIDSGIYTAEFAAQQEGYLPGDIEYAPVPPAQPAAVPDALPGSPASTNGPVRPYLEQRDPEGNANVQIIGPTIVRSEAFRCDGMRTRNGILTVCGKLLAAGWIGRCPRCKRDYAALATAAS